jgi:hypothetical protein
MENDMNSKSLTLAAIALSTLFTSTAFAKKTSAHSKKQDVSKQEAPKEVVSDETCAAFIAHKPGLNGFAVSFTGGILSNDMKVTNETTGFDIHNKNVYKSLGFGINHFWTMKNNVVYGLGLDLIANFGSKKSDGVGSFPLIPINGAAYPEQVQLLGNVVNLSPADARQYLQVSYTQKRPLTIIIGGKIGYAYGNFVPYVMFNLRESYVKHEFTLKSNTSVVKEEKDLNIALEIGTGFMYKAGDFGFGAEVGYHKESTLGLEGYGAGKNNGCYSAMGRISYFF